MHSTINKKWAIAILALISLSSCGNNADSGKDFSVSGIIRNSSAKMIYLEEVPAATMQPRLADSAKLDKDGKFSLKAGEGESVVFNLRLDQSTYPVASVINDSKDIKLDILLSKENSQFAEKYDVTGSPASQMMKDFMYAFNNELQKIYPIARQADSLKRAAAADTLIFPLVEQQQSLAASLKAYSEKSFKQATDPALLLFEVGYYQSTANGAGFGLIPLDDSDVNGIVGDGVKRFPMHQALSAIKVKLDEQRMKSVNTSLVGKQAPDFSSTDPNGKSISLSSFRGKYVLVDFWASWCGPCREENPNVVRAFQKYKDKNFTVFGVSLDRPGQKDNWLKAIKEDNLTWTHVSDLQFWQTPVVSLYHIEGIPFNVLIDPSGKVIGESLRGSNLDDKLLEVLR